jgi:glycosyltransferase involved in cell wall biosynthesis
VNRMGARVESGRKRLSGHPAALFACTMDATQFTRLSATGCDRDTGGSDAVPTVSVVIPVLNDAKMLENCLSSLDAQSRAPFEVIVVDNGCTDDSVAVARAHGATVILERRAGIAAASAAGFDAARGAIIARCDADSRLPRDWVERIEFVLASRSGAAGITGTAHFYDLGPVGGTLAKVIYLYGFYALLRVILGHNVLFGSNCAIRADAWRAVSARVPRDDPEIHDDIDLSFRLPPRSIVILDRKLDAGISGRPFFSAVSFWRRVVRAGHTFRVHPPAPLPKSRRTKRTTFE